MDRPLDPRPARRRRRLLWLGASVTIILVLLLASVTLGRDRVRVARDRVGTGVVVQGQFREYIPVTGTVQPIRTVFLDAVQGGVVEEVFVEDGHPIQAGEPILRLANQQFQMDAINREAQLLDQQNNLRTTRLSMDQQTNTWKQQLLQLEYDLKQLERTYRLNEGLKERDLVAPQEYERSREEYELALERRDLLKANIRNDSLFRRSQEGQIDASLELIDDNLAFLRRSLENLTVRAPIDGQLSGLRAEIGQTIAQGIRIAQIDVLDAYKVRARIGEHYVARVGEGLSGTFSFAGGDHQLTVAKVYPEVSNGEFEADLYFTGDAPDGIRRGQSLQVRLQLSEDMQAVMVPRGAWFQDTGGSWVYVLKDGVAVKRDVELGRQNPDHYEVRSGLQPGDTILTSRYEAFNNAGEVLLE
ncbi:MAG TPA: efflux RND transporter periplasmic adaptor subunit [Flavobacteriales bacterium]|nr:efflux RND transporter periplasmic adaptor subunit [Flavobacteriales bacterium]